VDDGGVKIRFPAGTRDFTVLSNIEIDSWAHQASCTIGSGGCFPEGKAHLPPSVAEVKNRVSLLLGV
jgi:hypothetical protein